MQVWEKIYKEIGHKKIVLILKSKKYKRILEFLLKPDKKVVRLVPIIKKRKYKKILDLGCGCGRHMVYLGKKKLSIVGLDISSTALKIAQKWLEEEKVKNYFLVEHDMIKLPFPDNHFDVIVSINVIHHNPLKKIRKTVNEIRRVLKKGGITLLTLSSTKDWKFGEGRKIEKNTYATPGSEHSPKVKGKIIHHFFDKSSVKKLFSKFKIIKLEEEIIDLNIEGIIKKNAHWVVLCQKS